MSKQVENFISSHWDECIKISREDYGDHIGLPYPYTVPAVGHFDDIYYWDTYFINRGLLRRSRAEQAKNNVDNMLYLVDRFGFMPNGNRTYFLKNSQPPFLSLMVRDIFEYYNDKAWLFGAYHILTKEYQFWQTKRITETGLNRYDGLLPDDMPDYMSKQFEKRCGFMPDGEKYDIARHCIACCECGWDINPRWGIREFDFNPVDLNSLLYAFEKNMSYFAKLLENGEENLWDSLALKRLDIMNKLMKKDGYLTDYNFAENTHSDIFSVASFYPLFVKLVDKQTADTVHKNLYRLEADYGILTCEKNDAQGNYQWDYPNGWACLQYITVKGLLNYGYTDDAKRIAIKYLKLVDKVFEETGNLWEKYNVIDGNIKVTNESYHMPSMMGWSAGVYLELSDIAEALSED